MPVHVTFLKNWSSTLSRHLHGIRPSLSAVYVCLLVLLFETVLLASFLKGVKISVAIILMCFIASLFIAALCKKLQITDERQTVQ